MNTVRLGVVGAGEIATFTARDLLRHPAVRITAVADTNPDRAETFARTTGADAHYPNADALLERTDLDAVYVAVPNLHHEAVACAALERGLPVLLDKPFAMDIAAAERIAATAHRQDVLLMIGMNQRFERNVQRARAICRSGRLGEIYHVKAFWRRRAGIPRLGSWFTSRAVAGGGALLDIGVHVLDVAMHLLDDFSPRTVSGATFARFGPRGLGEGGWGKSEREHDSFDVDDFATAFIRLEGGAVISLEASWALHQGARNDHDVILYGDDAGMAVYSDELFEATADGGYQTVQGAAAEVAFPHCSRAHHFVNVLLGTEPLMIEVDEALAVQRVLDGIYESARSGREVCL